MSIKDSAYFQPLVVSRSIATPSLESSFKKHDVPLSLTTTPDLRDLLVILNVIYAKAVVMALKESASIFRDKVGANDDGNGGNHNGADNKNQNDIASACTLGSKPTSNSVASSSSGQHVDKGKNKEEDQILRGYDTLKKLVSHSCSDPVLHSNSTSDNDSEDNTQLFSKSDEGKDVVDAFSKQSNFSKIAGMLFPPHLCIKAKTMHPSLRAHVARMAVTHVQTWIWLTQNHEHYQFLNPLEWRLDAIEIPISLWKKENKSQCDTNYWHSNLFKQEALKLEKSIKIRDLAFLCVSPEGKWELWVHKSSHKKKTTPRYVLTHQQLSSHQFACAREFV